MKASRHDAEYDGQWHNVGHGPRRAHCSRGSGISHRGIGEIRVLPLNFRNGSLADIATAMELVRFVPEADLSLQLEKLLQCRLDLHGE